MAGDITKRRGAELLAVAGSIVAILAVFIATTLLYLQERTAIANLDFWYHIGVGQQARWSDPQSLVDGLYPIGYPLLLRLAVDSGIDALRFGQFLSVFGSVLCLAALYALLLHVTSSVPIASAGVVLLALNPHFVQFATFEGNDMLAAGLQVLAVASLWRATDGDATTPHGICVVISGVILGIAYLTRNTALIFVLIALLYLAIVYRRSPATLLRTGALLLFPFLLVTAVQWAPSWYFHQNPLYNIQAKNIWFGIYGNSDWVNNWHRVPDTISLTEVIRMDAGRFTRHWYEQFVSALLLQRLWPLPLHLGWLAALATVVLLPRLALSRRLFVLMLALVPVAVTALAWVAPRFLLGLLWVQALTLTLLVFYLATAVAERMRIGAGASVAVFLCFAVVLQWPGLMDWFHTPANRRPDEINRFLRLSGMVNPRHVATNDPYLHAVDDVARSRYAQVTDVMADPPSAEALLTHPRAADWRYLVLDYESGFGEYVDMRAAFREAKGFLVPLMLSETRDIFCLVPCSFAETVPVTLDFNNGIQLRGYRLQQTQQAGTLFLYWKTSRHLERSYKISVRLRGSDGTDRVQIDNVPQLWTYPTTAWPVDETIVDFYSWEYAESCGGCQPGIVVYNSETLEPLAAVQAPGPIIPLTP